MPDSQAGIDQWEATINLLLDGEDYTFTTFQQGEILKLLNRTFYLKTRLDENPHIWATLQQFNAGFKMSGASGIAQWRTMAVPNASTATLGAGDADIFYFTTLSQNIVITLKSTSPAPPDGAVIRFLKRGGGNFNVTFLREGGATIGGNALDNVQAFGISFAFTNGLWTAYSWSGGGGSMGL